MITSFYHLLSTPVKQRLDDILTYKDSPNVSELIACRPRKVLILGSGGLSIGQAGEFDYSGSQVMSPTGNLSRERCKLSLLLLKY